MANAAKQGSQRKRCLEPLKISGLSLENILGINNPSKMNSFLQKLTNDVNVTVDYFGQTENNARTLVNSNPFAALGERITNGLDAVIDSLAKKNGLKGFTTPRDILTNVYTSNTPPVEVTLHGRCKGTDKDYLVVDVQDSGIGISSEKMLSTILMSGGSHKLNSSIYIGVFGQGGSSTLGHSQSVAIFTREQGSGVVNVAFIAKILPEEYNPVTKQKQSRVPCYVMFLDNTGQPFTVSAYNSKTEEVFPEGTLVRHFNYQIRPKDYKTVFPNRKSTSSFLETMEHLFPNLPTNVTLTDKVDGSKTQNLSKYIKPSIKNLDNANYVEYKNSAKVFLSSQDGFVELSWYVLDEESVKKGLIHSYCPQGQCGSVYLNGQAIEFLSSSLTKKAQLPFLQRSLVLYANLEGASDRAKTYMLLPSREKLQDLFKETLHDHIVEHLQQDEGLAVINNKRAKMVSSDGSNQTVKIIQKHFREYLEGNKVGQKARNSNTKTAPEPITPLDIPTFLEVTHAKKAVYPSQSFSLKIRTDIPSKDFDNLIVSTSLPIGSHFDVSNWSISLDENDISQGHKTLAGLTVREDAEIGHMEKIQLTLPTASGITFTAEVDVIVVEKPPRNNNGNMPDIHIQWLDTEDTNSLQLLGFSDEEGNVLQDKVCTVKVSKEKCDIFLLKTNENVQRTLQNLKIKYANDDESLGSKISHFLDEYYAVQMSMAALGFIYKDEQSADEPSKDVDPDTTFELLMKNVSRASCAWWDINHKKVIV